MTEELLNKPLKFVPTRSFVEASFFKKLSELKLNELKLSTDLIPISGFMNHPANLTKFQDHPILNLDFSSFEAPQKDGNIHYKGLLYNVNTIEEFKALNKQDLLKNWGKEVQKLLTSGDFSYQSINKFFVLTFCDLKKYKFYYWFAYPSVPSQWVVKSCEQDLTLHTKTAEYLDSVDKFELFFVKTNDGYKPFSTVETKATYIFVDTCQSPHLYPGWQLRNYLYALADLGLKDVDLFVYRHNGNSVKMSLHLHLLPLEVKFLGWERILDDRLGPKMADLGSLIDPKQLADQAVDLNLKLMKWRIAPKLDLEKVGSLKVLLLGSGTLGSYVARALMGWGVRHITFVDNGRVSYSNPVRQPLFAFNDCFSDDGRGQLKAVRAAEAMKEIFPGIRAYGHNLEVPMIGHPVQDETRDKDNFDALERLVDDHDVIYLLMDSRESRWLPTLLGMAKNKLVINAALGFDSYLVMRHGTDTNNLGCYYCNDVVAPSDSLSDRTLDQMCTVTRPGGALMASSLAVELMVSVVQHPEGKEAGASESSFFGNIPHQIRGFLHNFLQTKLTAPKYLHCSACSEPVVEAFRSHGWEFVQDCLNSSKYLEKVCGLEEVQRKAEEASAALLEQTQDLDLSDDEWLQ